MKCTSASIIHFTELREAKMNGKTSMIDHHCVNIRFKQNDQTVAKIRLACDPYYLSECFKLMRSKLYTNEKCTIKINDSHNHWMHIRKKDNLLRFEFGRIVNNYDEPDIGWANRFYVEINEETAKIFNPIHEIKTVFLDYDSDDYDI